MRFRRDETAQAVQIGAVLLFGILIIILSSFQAFVVPDQNEGVEFEHNQEVQQQLQSTGSLITSVGGGGSGGSETIILGTTYPSRSIFANPGPASGRLQTDELGAIRIEYSDITGNEPGVSEYWNGTARSYPTNALVYSPNYNEYSNAPDTRYEHSLVYNDFGQRGLAVSDQSLINEDGLTVVTLEGNYSESSVTAVSLDVRALSSSENTVTLDGETGSVEVSIPTERPDLWDEQLNGFSTDVNSQDGFVNVTLSSDQGLRMARVGVGDARRGTPNDRSRYVAVTETRAPAVTVEVRDRYNNPVRGANVTISGTDDTGSTLRFVRKSSDLGAVNDTDKTEITLVSDRNGEIEIENLGDGNLLNFTGTDIPYPLTNFEVREGSGTGTGTQPAYNVYWNETRIANENSNIRDDDGLVLNQSQGMTADLFMFTEPIADTADVSYSVNDSGVGTLTKTGITDGNGENATTFSDPSQGSVTLYTSSGSDGDRLQLAVEGSSTQQPEFTQLDATLETGSPGNSPGNGGNSRPDTVVITSFDITSSDTVTFTATESGGETVTSTSAGSGSNIELDFTEGGQNLGDFDVVVTAQIQNGECKEVTFSSGGSKSLTDWGSCS